MKASLEAAAEILCKELDSGKHDKNEALYQSTANIVTQIWKLRDTLPKDDV